jgi:hypothetical protein
MLRPIPQEIVYKGTISGLRISAIDSVAFIDNCSAITAYADNAHKVEIYHSNGARLVGIAKEAGSGETLGDEILDDTGFDDSGSWIKQGNWSVAGSAASVNNNTSANFSVYQSKARTLGVLYKGVAVVGSYTSGGYDILLVGITGSSYNPSQTTDRTKYLTAHSTDTGQPFGLINRSSVSVLSIASLSIKPVTAPSTDGIIITNAKGGSTENFLTQDSGFVHNEASYTVIVKKLRG